MLFIWALSFSDICGVFFPQGPTFGAMMMSGVKAAHLAREALGLSSDEIPAVGSLHPEMVIASADNADVADA